MKRVVIESPLKGQVPTWCPRWLAPVFERYGRWKNKRYAMRCVLDSLSRGEAPYASHLFFDRPGMLDDSDDVQRRLGMEAGFAWGEAAELRAVYIDRGVSSGMQLGLQRAEQLGQAYEIRHIRGQR